MYIKDTRHKIKKIAENLKFILFLQFFPLLHKQIGFKKSQKIKSMKD